MCKKVSKFPQQKILRERERGGASSISKVYYTAKDISVALVKDHLNNNFIH